MHKAGYKNRVELHRKKAGLSVAALAGAVQRTKHILYKYERQEIQPSDETLDRLCEVFKCKKSDLLYFE